jgi:hypothetical protein
MQYCGTLLPSVTWTVGTNARRATPQKFNRGKVTMEVFRVRSECVEHFSQESVMFCFREICVILAWICCGNFGSTLGKSYTVSFHLMWKRPVCISDVNASLVPAVMSKPVEWTVSEFLTVKCSV